MKSHPYQTLYTRICLDRDLKSTDHITQLVFFWLKFSRENNLINLFPLELPAFASRHNLTVKQVETALKELYGIGWVEYEDGLIWIVNGLRFNVNASLSSDKIITAIHYILADLPSAPIIQRFKNKYEIPPCEMHWLPSD